MAVGKGSMERAAKAAEAKKASAPKKTESKASVKKEASAAKTAGKAETKAVAAAEVIAAPSEEVLQQIIYQKSSGMLEREAAPNERFGLGDEMPVYYF